MPASRPQLTVLGPIGLTVDGRPIPLGGSRQLTVFALLVAAGGKAVSTDHLIDEVWREDPPPSARNTLQSYITRLRSVLGREVIASTGTGYRLDLEGWTVDAHALEEAAATGEGLRAAAALLNGIPYEGAVDTPTIVAERTRLQELALQASERAIEAELADQPAGLIPELEALVAAHPLRERLWGLLMLALYRAGRQAEALGAFSRLRLQLAEELGVEPSAELASLEDQILRHDPALVPQVRPRRWRLPADRSSFVGRENELADLGGLLSGHRLVSVVGPGGSGKTRLALRAAAASRRDAAFVDLSSITASNLVAARVAAALGVAEEAATDPTGQVAAAIGDEPLLLLLDNCEQVVEAVRDLVDFLLAACPVLTVLTTSRVVLASPGEVVFPAEPLALPSRAAAVEGSDAVRLFVERAQEVNPRFTLNDGNREAVVASCRAVDGLPLGIELAAASLRILSPEEVAQGLRERLELLPGGPGRPRRHRSLQAAVEGSYQLLDTGQQQHFEELSVFNGPFALPELEAVTGDTRQGALATAAVLVDSSLLRFQPESRTYNMLVTIARFGRERLAARGAETAVRDVLLHHLLEVTAAAGPRVRQADCGRWIGRLRAVADHVGAAVAHALGGGRVGEAARLLSAMVDFWYLTSAITEGEALIEQVVEAARRSGDPEVLLDALTVQLEMLFIFEQDMVVRGDLAAEIAVLAERLGREEEAAMAAVGLVVARAAPIEAVEEPLRYLEEEGRHRSVVLALTTVFRLLWWNGDHRRAEDIAHRFHRLARRSGDRLAALEVMMQMVSTNFLRDEITSIRGMIEEMADPAGDLGVEWVEIPKAQWMAVLLEREGDLEGAWRWLQRAHQLSADLGMLRQQTMVASHMAVLCWERGDDPAAHRWLGAFVDLCNRLGDLVTVGGGDSVPAATPFVLELAGSIATRGGDYPVAARWLGAAERAREPGGMTPQGMVMPVWDVPRQQATLADLRKRLPAAVLDEEWRKGREMDLATALTEALGWVPGRT